MKNVIKKIFKVIGIILLVIVILIALLFLGAFIYHKVQLGKEEKILADKGYKLVSVGDYSLGVYTYGSDSPKHTLVCLGGSGDNTFLLDFKKFTDRFADENKIVFVDRPGYGFSDDAKNITLQSVVDDCRTALKNEGIEGPYVLVPHSYGGLYGAYWTYLYPDEVEGEFNIEGMLPPEDPSDLEAPPTIGVFAALNKTGIQRVIMPLLAPGMFEYPDDIDADFAKALSLKNVFSSALKCEVSKAVDFTDRTKLITENDVPKVYIKAQYALDTEERVRAYYDGIKKKYPDYEYPSDEEVKEMADDMKRMGENVVKPFAERVGNCKIVEIPGDHFVYDEDPDKLENELRTFLGSLK